MQERELRIQYLKESPLLKNKRVIIEVQSFIIKCLSFCRVSFVQRNRLCIEKTLHLNNPFLKTMNLIYLA